MWSVVVSVMNKWNSPERAFFKINTMCPLLGWVWVSSGCAQVSQKGAQEQPVPREPGAESVARAHRLRAPRPSGDCHQKPLVTAIRNPCRWGCHSSWVPGLRYHEATLLSDYSVYSEKQASITTWLPQISSKLLSGFENLDNLDNTCLSYHFCHMPVM